MTTAQLNVRLPVELLNRLRVESNDSGRPITNLVESFIEQGLASSELSRNETVERLSELEERLASVESALPEAAPGAEW